MSSQITTDTLKRFIIKPSWNDGCYEYLKFQRLRYSKGTFIIPTCKENIKVIISTLNTKYNYSLSTGANRLYKLLPEPKKAEVVQKTYDISKVKCNLKIELKDYQKEGLCFLNENNGRGLVAFDQGLGKTATAIAWFSSNQYKTLIICPSSIKFVWVDELLKFTGQSSYIITTKDKTVKGLIATGVKYFIINYDIIQKQEKLLTKLKLDALVLDESQMIMNKQAARTKAVHRIKKHFKYRVALSGTPIKNKVKDLFSQLNYLRPDIWSNAQEFYFRYCAPYKTPWGWNFDGSSNADELAHRISPLMIRRLKKDVLKELPDKTFQIIKIEQSPKTKKAYKLAVTNFAEYLEKNKGFSKKRIDKSMSAQAVCVISVLKQLLLQDKIKALKQILSGIEGKAVIFCEYQEGVMALKKLFGSSAVVLSGQTVSSDRKKVVDAFQNDPTIKYFIGSSAAFCGITLTSSHAVYFVTLPWCSSDLQQASDRCHRISQKNAVNVYLLNAGDIDTWILDKIMNKAAISDQILQDGHSLRVKGSQFIRDFFKKK